MLERYRDLPLRIISAVALMMLLLCAMLYHRDSFTMLLVIAGYILGREWQRLNIENNAIFAIVGFAYIVASVFSLYWLRSAYLPHANDVRQGVDYLWLLFTIVWATDIGAYFCGRLFAGKKLWPAVSPNKTWSGAIGGTMIALVVSFGVANYLTLPIPTTVLMVIALLTSIISQLGDLFESHLKRRARVKDSGALIPGHGGLFDRVDGLMAAAPIYALMVMLI